MQLKSQNNLDLFKEYQAPAVWLFNCTWYCPISVALLEWCSYLVKVVEVWWCPFHHSKKESYVPVSQSFWHVNPKNKAKMHSEDRDNPMFVDIHKKNLDL